MKKQFLILSVILVLLQIPAFFLHSAKGVMINDRLFLQKSDTFYKNGKSYVELSPTETGASVKGILFGDQELSVEMEVERYAVTFAYPDEVIVANFLGDMLVTQDNLPLAFGVVYANSEVSLQNEGVRNQVSAALYDMYMGNVVQRGAPIYLPLFMLLSVIGASVFLWPEKMHRWGSRWRYDKLELSYDGIMMEKIGGVIGMIAGVILPYLALL